ncbi:MAG TPA: LLM class flavin-dependent oxidoreductase [Nitrolancea sp.]|nr:LLM class flavin-dependent oxidoreductase [Nitrolancea sp.]
MPAIDFSIRFPPSQPPEVLIPAVERAETAGFKAIWMVDTPLIAGEIFDPYIDLTIAALHSKQIRLGPAVSTFSLRHPLAVASAMLSLDRAAGQRAVLGLGVGGSALITLGEMSGHQGAFVRDSMTARREKLRQGILALKQIFAGESVSFGAREIRLSQPRQIPIYLAASGPKALELAGEVADGAIIQVGIEPRALSTAIAAVHRGAERAGRDPESIKIVASTFAVVSHDRADDIDRVRPIASYFYSVIPEVLAGAGIDITKRYPDWVPRPDLTHAYDWNEAMAAAATYIPNETVERFCLVGPPEQARQQIAEIAALGVHEVFLRWCSTYDLPDPLVETFRTEIIPHFRSSGE